MGFRTAEAIDCRIITYYGDREIIKFRQIIIDELNSNYINFAPACLKHPPTLTCLGWLRFSPYYMSHPQKHPQDDRVIFR
jgi:hypothetical protein